MNAGEGLYPSKHGNQSQYRRESLTAGNRNILRSSEMLDRTALVRLKVSNLESKARLDDELEP
jgi:hypothetical protein